ncbi:MAG: L-seryl-tRNA(Sec) selenium transferase [Bacillota bacterium]
MDKKTLLGLLPKVDELLSEKEIVDSLSIFPRVTIVEAIRENIDHIRKTILSLAHEEDIKNYQIDHHLLISNILASVKTKNQMRLKKVINTTGVVLHTNLGRSLLSADIKDEVWDVASSYSTLEYDIHTGQRGSRYSHVEEIIRKLTGAEAALVVNNNAAAVMLVLGTMAKGREVIVSRGQLVEVGGSFRIPDVMQQSGARLVEVGATNKTHLSDYEKAIHEETAALLKVHTSNYRILGFTKEVGLDELIHLGEKYQLPVIEDIGSGTLIDFRKYGLTDEPTVQDSLRLGADIVTFSGDKLLGGPQAGIIVGKKKYIDQMKKNPLTRAFRVDKLTLAALEATLRIYLDEEKALMKIPTLRMLTMKIDEINIRSERLMNDMKRHVRNCVIEKVQGYSQVGGGSMPLENLPTMLISLYPQKISVNMLERRLRQLDTPIIVRINEDRILLDVRTIQEEEFGILVEHFTDILND